MANLRKKNAAPLGPAQRLAIEDRRRRRARLVGIIIAVWAVIALLYGVTMRGRYTHFTRINGLRASGKTPQAMAEKIERLCSEMQVTIFEDDMPQLTTTLADLGYLAKIFYSFIHVFGECRAVLQGKADAVRIGNRVIRANRRSQQCVVNQLLLDGTIGHLYLGSA